MKLWYKSPAREWLEGLPIGTGRLAAMVLGTFRRERIALNHECLWKGVNRRRDNEVRREALPEVRRLLLAGNYEDGTRAARDAFGGGGGGSGRPQRVDPYQPAGDLYLEFLTRGPISDYHRELDLDTASATVSYLAGGRRFTRQYVAHLVEDLILVRLTHDGLPFDCVAWLDRTYDADCELTFDTDAGDTGEAGTQAARLTMTGCIRDGVDFRVQGDVWCRGGRRRVVDGRKLLCEGVTEAVVAVDIGVSAFGRSAATECNSRRVQAPAATECTSRRVQTAAATECTSRRLQAPAAWDDLFRAHVREHQRHYGSMRLDLPLAATDVADLPTDERIRRVRAGQPDPGLPLLYFHYGRYLLCASSANAALPANLQGKWNEDLQPPWDSDYHHDINLQMNYWLAEPAGMQRYVEALLQHIERFVPHARKAAMDLYGCRGVWYPIQTDAWGRSTPESHGWAVWIGAAPWLAQHLWWHYEYGRDAGFLRDRAYPFFKEVAAFYEDYLVEDGAGVLQIVPSQSPENRFVGDGGPPVSICVSATMDVILARAAFDYAIRSAEILDLDRERRQRWRDLDRAPSGVADRPPRPVAGVERGLRRGRTRAPARVPPDRTVPRRPAGPGADPRAVAGGRAEPGAAAGCRRRAHRLESGVDGLPVRAAGPCRRCLATPQPPDHRLRHRLTAGPAPAAHLPDRRQPRRRGGGHRDAAAELSRRAPPAAGSARRVARGQRVGPAGPRRRDRGDGVARRRAGRSHAARPHRRAVHRAPCRRALAGRRRRRPRRAGHPRRPPHHLPPRPRRTPPLANNQGLTAAGEAAARPSESPHSC